MIKTIITGIIAAVMACGALLAFSHQPVPSPVRLGALAGPDIQSPYLSWGGVTTYKGAVAMHSATTTLCAIQSPSSTSTVAFASWNVTTGTSTAASIDIGVGSTAYATSTTLLSATSLSSGAQGGAAWGAPNGTTAVIGPNNYVIVKTNGAGLGGYTFGGNCTAQFNVL